MQMIGFSCSQSACIEAHGKTCNNSKLTNSNILRYTCFLVLCWTCSLFINCYCFTRISPKTKQFQDCDAISQIKKHVEAKPLVDSTHKPIAVIARILIFKS